MDENDPPSAVCIELQKVQYKYEYRKEMSSEKKSNMKKAKKIILLQLSNKMQAQK